METNEEAVAELLHTMWWRDGRPKWSDLVEMEKEGFRRQARYVLGREVQLIAQLANKCLRKRHEERLLKYVALTEKRQDLKR